MQCKILDMILEQKKKTVEKLTKFKEGLKFS